MEIEITIVCLENGTNTCNPFGQTKQSGLLSREMIIIVIIISMNNVILCVNIKHTHTHTTGASYTTIVNIFLSLPFYYVMFYYIFIQIDVIVCCTK